MDTHGHVKSIKRILDTDIPSESVRELRSFIESFEKDNRGSLEHKVQRKNKKWTRVNSLKQEIEEKEKRIESLEQNKEELERYRRIMDQQAEALPALVVHESEKESVGRFETRQDIRKGGLIGKIKSKLGFCNGDE